MIERKYKRRGLGQGLQLEGGGVELIGTAGA